MPVRLTPEEIQFRVSNMWGGVAEIDMSTFVDMKTLTRFVDRDYGEWWAKPFHVMKGTGRHPHRAKACSGNARKISTEEVKRRVEEKHAGNVTLNVATYKDTHTKASFVDSRYGEWWAKPYAVMQGMGHPKGRLKKAIATMLSFAPVIHWNTGEVCNPVSGFEHAVLVWLNDQRYDFDWQIPFEMPELTPKLRRHVIYNVDLYIKSGPFVDTYVEIKGTWARRSNNDGGKAKWEWFHSKNLNSQLWMRDDLKRLGIIDAQRSYLEKARK